ncbi:hypothetical protein EV122DRAFT_286758 [Schizophyllum commune]
MTTNCTTSTGPTLHTRAATASESHGRFEGDSELSRSPRQDSTRESEVETHSTSRDSAAQTSSSSNTASCASLSDERIAYLLSDEAFLNHYALAGSEWGWGYGPLEAESSGSEAETNSGTAPSLDTSSGTSASSASSSTQNPPQGDPSHACTICHKQFTRSVSFPSKYIPPNLASRNYLILLAKSETHCSSQAKHACGAHEHASRSYA